MDEQEKQDTTPATEGEAPAAEMTEEERHQKILETLVEYVRYMGAHKRPITLEQLAENAAMPPEEVQQLMDEARQQETFHDICVYEGAKANYYYTYPLLAHNYVRAIALEEAKDIPNTVLTLVRYDSQRYPRPTRGKDFGKNPYGYTLIQVKNAVAELRRKPENSDITEYTSRKGTYFIYSTKYLSDGYARYLAEDSEDMSLKF